MKTSSILPSFVSGITTHSGNSFFATAKQEQHLTKEEKAKQLHDWNVMQANSRKRQREIKRRFPNSKVLYV